MKIRTGFISNSSTSSFIVKGYLIEKDKVDLEVLQTKIQETYPDIKEMIDKYKEQGWEDEIYYETSYKLRDNGLYFTENEEDGAPKNHIIFGQLIEDSGSDDYLHDHIIDCSLDEKMVEIKNIISPAIKENIDDQPVKIIIGTRMC